MITRIGRTRLAAILVFWLFVFDLEELAGRGRGGRVRGVIVFSSHFINKNIFVWGGGGGGWISLRNLRSPSRSGRGPGRDGRGGCGGCAPAVPFGGCRRAFRVHARAYTHTSSHRISRRGATRAVRSHRSRKARVDIVAVSSHQSLTRRPAPLGCARVLRHNAHPRPSARHPRGRRRRRTRAPVAA